VLPCPAGVIARPFEKTALYDSRPAYCKADMSIGLRR
jgi:hypothetical protein